MLGIYIHIPFCKKKCNYCDFTSFDGCSPEIIDRYLTALSKEISSLSTIRCPITTIYIGGGTPSILSCRQIEYLFSNIYKFIKPDTFSEIITDENQHLAIKINEITFECNPESIDEEKLKLLKSLGVNRLSFGVQSFSDEELKFLGRVHTTEEFLNKYDIARKIGFDNINIDLIYGLPQQMFGSWKTSLKRAVALSPEHISVYPLTIEPATKLYYEGTNTSDELQERMFNYTREFLYKNDYIHYEISNFARASYESKHNLNYWRGGQYLGFGVSAASYFGNKRWKNTADIKKYISTPTHCAEEIENIDEKTKISEKLILGLRLLEEGVELDEKISKKYNFIISQFQKSGMLKVVGNRLFLTEKSIFVSNNIFCEFV